MNIKSFDDVRWTNNKWDLNVPSFKMIQPSLASYIVQRGEDMRIDLVMKSIYDDIYNYKDIDILLYINNIDNPLNIREGMILYYPELEAFEGYRFYEEVSAAVKKSVKQSLGVLNKTTRVDEKRKKFLDSDYSLPPVVLQESRPSVTMDEFKIKVGGL
jgi:hypothetical protein